MSGDEVRWDHDDELMLAKERKDREFDAQIIGELERVPEISAMIPVEFAARVAAKVPAKSRPTFVRARSTQYGRAAMGVSLVVLFVALAVLAARGVGSSMFGLAVEWTLGLQFLAIAVWMGSSRGRSH